MKKSKIVFEYLTGSEMVKAKVKREIRQTTFNGPNVSESVRNVVFVKYC